MKGIIWRLRNTIFRTLKGIVFHSPLRHRVFHFYRYTYMYQPDQLIFLCQCIKETKDIPGIFMEIGCAKGHTTVFLNKFMNSIGMERKYLALDTFVGFTSTDIKYELEQRKQPYDYYDFAVNSQKWFDGTMEMNGISRVESWKGDARDFDFSGIESIAFCILDIDLYEPTRDVLPQVYEKLAPGGTIVVDDCEPNSKWDGALQAYQEFVAQHNMEGRIVHRKLGLIGK